MISEGSCDTEDWGNDADNSPLLQRNKLHFKIYSNRKLAMYQIDYFSIQFETTPPPQKKNKKKTNKHYL